LNNRKLLKYHSYFGLISGIFLIILGISGAILIFSENIDSQLFKEYSVKPGIEVLDLDKAVESVQKEYPDWETRIVHFKKGETILFNLRRLESRKYLFVHPETGAIIADINAETQFTMWLVRFHYSMHAGIFGNVLMLIMGIIFFLSLLTGIIVYRKIILKTLFFQVKLKTKNRRGFYSVLHRYVGVWALLFNLVLVITGVVLSYGVVQAGFKTAEVPKPPVITISINKSLALIKQRYPDFTPSYLRLPKQDHAAITVNGVFKGDPFYFREFNNKIELNPESGTITAVTKITEASWETKVNALVSPLHFGQYGGFPIKIFYCLVGLSGPFLSITGFLIWKKRKHRNKPSLKI